MLPKPLQKLYDKASLFLDKDSTHQDHYWRSEYTRQSIKLFQISGEPMQLRRLEKTQERKRCRPAKFPRMISATELGTTSATPQGDAQ